MRENMEQHFNTPAEVIDNNMKAGEGKAHLPLGKMILLGIMAGAFIALGGATSSTAAHAIDNVGLARFVAGIIFPVGLMIIVFVGGELFTGNCLIVMDVVGKKVTWFECIRNLIVVYFSNPQAQQLPVGIASVRNRSGQVFIRRQASMPRTIPPAAVPSTRLKDNAVVVFPVFRRISNITMLTISRMPYPARSRCFSPRSSSISEK